MKTTDDPSVRGGGTAPRGGRAPVRRTLRGLTQVESRSFPVRAPGWGEDLRETRRSYFRDLSLHYGLEAREEDLDGATGNSYMSMAEQLLPEIDSGRPFDYVAIAMTVPNSDPLQSVVSWLVDLLPGSAMPLGVGDQGVVAPFTALRLLSAYTEGERPARSMLLAFDRRFVPYFDDGREGPIPTSDTVVALVFDGQGGGDLTVALSTGVTPAEAGPLASAEIADAGEDVDLIVGRGLEEPAASWPKARLAERGAPCTGIWTRFAEWYGSAPENGRGALLLDHDRGHGYLGHCLYRP